MLNPTNNSLSYRFKSVDLQMEFYPVVHRRKFCTSILACRFGMRFISDVRLRDVWLSNNGKLLSMKLYSRQLIDWVNLDPFYITSLFKMKNYYYYGFIKFLRWTLCCQFFSHHALITSTSVLVRDVRTPFMLFYCIHVLFKLSKKTNNLLAG